MISNNFLWGGAISAHQCEGAYNIDGKLPCTADTMLAGGVMQHFGSFGNPIDESNYYPTHEAIDFYIDIKKILLYLKKWALIPYAQVLRGLEYFLRG